MANLTFQASALGAQNPVASFPAGVLSRTGPIKSDGTYFTAASSPQGAIEFDATLTGGLITVTAYNGVNSADTSANRMGPFLYNSATNLGYQLSQTSATQVVIHATNAGVPSTVLHTVTTATHAGMDIWGLRYTKNGAASTLEVLLNGAVQGAALPIAEMASIRGGAYGYSSTTTRGVRTMTAVYGVTVTELTSPLVPGAVANGRAVGAANGAATITIAGVGDVGATVASELFSFTVPTFADGVAYPALPATAVNVTFTQGADTSVVQRDIALPANTVKETFGTDLLVGNDMSIASDFSAAANALATGDISYATGGATVYKNGLVRLAAGASPYSQLLWVRRLSDGKMYSHTLTINGGGVVVITDPAPRSRSVLRVSGNTLTIDGATHTNGHPVSISPYGGMQPVVNGGWLAQSVSASAGALVIDGVTITPPKALYLSPAGKLTTTPNGRPVATVRS